MHRAVREGELGPLQLRVRCRPSPRVNFKKRLMNSARSFFGMPRNDTIFRAESEQDTLHPTSLLLSVYRHRGDGVRIASLSRRHHAATAIAIEHLRDQKR
jgi:hypothetical protein